MAPKYRGRSDDWLDNQDRKNSRSKRESRSSKAKTSPSGGEIPTESNATVAEIFPSLARVKTDEGTSLLCTYKRSKVLQDRGVRERSPVAVGDRVWV